MMQAIRSHEIRFLWHYIRPWKYRIALAFVGLTFVSFTSLLYPWLLKLMVDRFGGHASSGLSIDILCVTLVLVFSVSTLLGYYQQVETKTLGYRLRNALRIAFYQSLLSKSLSFHRQAQVGELSSRATEDIGKLQALFSSLLSPAFQNTLFIAGSLFLMAMLNWVATLIVIALVAGPIPFIYIMSKRIRYLSARSQADHAHANAFLEESLVAMREIKAFIREKLELRRYALLLEHAFSTEVTASMLHVKINQAVYFVISVALLAIFYAGSRQSYFPDWTLGSVVAFYFYSYTMTMAVLSVGKIYLAYQEFAGALLRVMELLTEEKPTAGPSLQSHKRSVDGKVAFHNVSFSYDQTKCVLRDVSLLINPGEWRLITGPSGSGKSTLANLLLGFYQPDQGSISVDGVPLGRWHAESLRRQIGYVGQDPVLIHGTLRENIAFSEHPVREEQLAWAIEQSCLSEVLRSMPEGLETIVGERGYTLSGGQKARVAIARAIIHEPAILVLDEATAMLEEELEDRLWKNLFNARARKTTIIFSHHYQNIPRIYGAMQLCNGTLRPLDGGGSPSTVSHHVRADTAP